MGDKNVDKPECKYGVDCYQRNQAHKDRFSHPMKNESDSSSEKQQRSSIDEPPTKQRKISSSESDNNSENENIVSNDVHASTSNDSFSHGNSTNGNSVQENDPQSVSSDEKPHSRRFYNSRCSEYIKENFDKGPHAQRAEYQKLLESPAEFINTKFLVKMPADFFEFWTFCENESKNNSKPENLFGKFGLSLVGPFDVLAKKFHKIDPFEPGDYLRHWRFYYDPPEFQVSPISLIPNSNIVICQLLVIKFHIFCLLI